MDIVYSIPITISPLAYKLDSKGNLIHQGVYTVMQSKAFEMVVANNKNTDVKVTEYLTDPDRYVGRYYIYINTVGTSEKFEYWLKDVITIYKFPGGSANTTAWIHLNPVEEVTEEDVKNQINILYEDIKTNGPITEDITYQHIKAVEQMAKEVKFEGDIF